MRTQTARFFEYTSLIGCYVMRCYWRRRDDTFAFDASLRFLSFCALFVMLTCISYNTDAAYDITCLA